MVSVVILVFNRMKNLGYWLAIMGQVPRENVTFTVIHNCEISFPEVRKRVEAAGAKYIPRQNVGMDIGAFQDVCRKRLPGFDYGYDFLLWFTDDCFAMKPSFVADFLAPFKDPLCGLTCLEISTQIKTHVRTTGFMLRKALAEKLKFPVDPVRTKEECYRFEHRGPHTLREQVLGAGLKAVQISALRESSAWDSGGGGHGWINRRQEFEKVWSLNVRGSKVVVIATAYETRPVLVESMLAQTFHNWELYLVHDGPAPNGFPRYDDTRVHFIEEPGPRKHYGHPIREQYLEKVKSGKIEGAYVVVTNHDNYHAPFFLEKLTRALDDNPDAPGAYCSAMVHNYAGFPGQVPAPGKQNVEDGYNIIQVKPERGYMDCACAMIRAPLAGAVGWPDYSHSSDWTYLNSVAQKNGGWARFKVVPGVLLVHN